MDDQVDPRKVVTVMMPCFNEEGNIREAYTQVKAVFDALPQYRLEQLFIDNSSTDGTQAILRELAAADPNVKVIINARNFGHIRSPSHALMQSYGDAVIGMASDLQDPPSLIPEFIKRWEEGHHVVLGVKESSEETLAMFLVRRLYYKLVTAMSEIPLVQNTTGFGLYDRRVMDAIRKINDPYPYFRGLLCDVGFRRTTVTYRQPLRKRGITKNNFYTLYDMAMLGITNHSKVPLRVATLAGFLMSALSLGVSMGYLVGKLLFWQSFPLGTAPLLVGMFLFFSIQLFFIGVLGEYIGAIHTHVQNRPLVVELERINF